MNLKEIEAMVASKFENVSQKDLLQAYAVVNVYKKQMGHLEADVKSALQNSFPKVKGGIQDSLSFSTGVAFDLQAGYSAKKKVSIKDLNNLERDLIISTTIDPNTYIRTTKTITKTATDQLYRQISTYQPDLLHHFEEQESLDFSVKIKEVS